jgi:hypothetical protein
MSRMCRVAPSCYFRYVRESTITKEQLIEFGMVETGDPFVPMRKVLGEGEEGEISINVTHERNITELVLRLPDGAAIFLTIATIEELKAFEMCIGSWSPNY